MGVGSDSLLADVGSGTGISAKIFLDAGSKVYGVEPNEAMRGAAEEFLSGYPKFVSVDGRADATTLRNDTVDIVYAAQAFHWFDPETARNEFKRILKPGGYIALIWNERQLDTTPFLIDYERLLLKFADDYTKVRHENVNEVALRNFFLQDFETYVFAISQVLDLDGLLGRAASSSYMPSAGHARFDEMENELRMLFAKHAESDRITVLYDTKVYFSKY
jgi:ubiquinone/menaquinone biosynthesis C-methylase UbiE